MAKKSKSNGAKLEHLRSPCPLACALDLIGDKWTLLIVRDLCFADKKTYKDLQNSYEKIATNVLADRLKKMEEAGLVEKRAYQDKPPRYEYQLTKKGRDLIPALKEIGYWGVQYIPDTWTPPPAAFPDRMKKKRKG